MAWLKNLQHTLVLSAFVGIVCLTSFNSSALSAAMLTDLANVHTEQKDKPNLVFIIADDCTFRDIGCYGGQALTPNIDAFAAQGMKFERCFQAAPMCSPTRQNIYTGLYPVKSGAYPNHTFTYDHVKSIVHYLEPHGYTVALSGKTHFNPRSVFPFKMLQGKDAKNPDMAQINSLFADSAKSLVDGENKNPFCLFACSNEPHSPWDKGDASKYPVDSIKLPPNIVDTPVVREAFGRYLAEITYFDSQVGQILAMLDKHGLRENTMVMVVSEQGSGFPFAKWTCYDNGLQSAMLVRWPGKIKPGSVTDAMVEYVDVTPTFVDVAGAEPIDGLDGKSFKQVLLGETDVHKSEVFGLMTTRGIIAGTEAYAIRSIRNSDYKLILNLNHESKFTNACSISREFKSMVQLADSGDANARKLVDAYHHRPAVELYKVGEDPLEMKNLADDPELKPVVDKLTAQLQGWMKEQGDQGVETEMKAHERQQRGKKKNRSKKKKSNSKQ
ncbi:MAG: sulfatase [Mariniblastus sp.]